MIVLSPEGKAQTSAGPRSRAAAIHRSQWKSRGVTGQQQAQCG